VVTLTPDPSPAKEKARERGAFGRRPSPVTSSLINGKGRERGVSRARKTENRKPKT
jgi:hypothetical protein